MGVKNCHHIISYPIDFQVSHLYSNIISNPYKIHDFFFWCSGGVCKLENSLWNLQPTSQDSIDAGSLYLLKCFFFRIGWGSQIDPETKPQPGFVVKKKSTVLSSFLSRFWTESSIQNHPSHHCCRSVPLQRHSWQVKLSQSDLIGNTRQQS